jgi:site-specific DNA-methyltransferase (adenine-specific)
MSMEDFIDKVSLGDCLDLMPQLDDSSIDMILADLPYGTTRNKWDAVIPFDEMWKEYERIIKPNGAIVLTSAQSFTSALVMSNPKLFKYEWIWSKTIGSGQLNAHKQPLRTHESVLVFYKSPPVYNPQMSEGKPYHAKRKATYEGPGYNQQKPSETKNEGLRLPKSVLDVPNPRIKGGHPTQKPLALMEYLIRTYTNEGELVLDNVVGSGTTAVAVINTHRHFVALEKDAVFYQISQDRIQAAYTARTSEANRQTIR